MAKGDYLYDAEVIIINPEGSGEHFTVYQVRDGQMFGPQHMEPGTSITRTARIGLGLVIVNNKSKDLPGLPHFHGPGGPPDPSRPEGRIPESDGS